MSDSFVFSPTAQDPLGDPPSSQEGRGGISGEAPAVLQRQRHWDLEPPEREYRGIAGTFAIQGSQVKGRDLFTWVGISIAGPNTDSFHPSYVFQCQ